MTNGQLPISKFTRDDGHLHLDIGCWKLDIGHSSPPTSAPFLAAKRRKIHKNSLYLGPFFYPRIFNPR